MAKLVKCKTCGAQIAKSARTCPHCGAKRKKHHFIRNFFILLLLLVIGLGSQVKKIPEVSDAIEEIQSALGTSTSTSKPSGTAKHETKPTVQPEAKPETAETPAAQTETTAASTPDPQPEVKEEAAPAASDTVTKELKDFLDSYEAFMNEYCDFAENYKADDLTMSLKLLDILAKEVDFAEKADAYKDTTMTAADEAYYIEAMLRIERRLLEASAKLQ